jgi:hypothetical protein
MVDGLHIILQNRTMKLLAIALSGVGKGKGGEMVGAIEPMCNISLFGIVTMNPPTCTMNIYQ